MRHDQRNATTAVLNASLRADAHDVPVAQPSIQEAVEEAFFRQRYRDAEYYSTGRDWGDYAPAYRYGRHAHAQHPGERFEDVETQLANDWCAAKDVSRLLWAEARGAVLDAWHHQDDDATAHAAEAG